MSGHSDSLLWKGSNLPIDLGRHRIVLISDGISFRGHVFGQIGKSIPYFPIRHSLRINRDFSTHRNLLKWRHLVILWRSLVVMIFHISHLFFIPSCGCPYNSHTCNHSKSFKLKNIK